MKTRFKKLLRFLKITKPIYLNEYEIRWIKLCKGHYRDKYRTNAQDWINTLKPLFREIYGYEPDNHYPDFLNCMFNKLLDTYLKIQRDRSGSNIHLREIFEAAWVRDIRRDYDKPIERCIAELCGQIQSNLVIENGIPRYYL